LEHVAAATAALVSRAAGGRGYGRGGQKWQISLPVAQSFRDLTTSADVMLWKG